MSADLLHRVEAFLREADMPPTIFGRLALRDPRFVGDLRRGRKPHRKTERRAIQYMDQWRRAYRIGRVQRMGDRRRTLSLADRALRDGAHDGHRAVELLRVAIERVQQQV